MSAPAAEVTLLRPARDALLGLKGRDAARALELAGVPVPASPNSWAGHPDTLHCLRLGAGEYLLHDAAATGAIARVRDAIASAALDCHPLLRADHCLRLGGQEADAVLLTVCDLDERRFLRQPQALALLYAAGVPVTLHALPERGGYAFWCDPTWSPHLLHTFRERLER